MKRMKRTAVLLAALLLLPTAARARMPLKAHIREDGRNSYTAAASKLTELPVLSPGEIRKTSTVVIYPEEFFPAETQEPVTVILPGRGQGKTEALEETPEETPPEAPTETPPEAPPEEESQDYLPQEKPAEPVPPAQPARKEAETPAFPEAEDWQLLLVNPWNELPEGYQVTLKSLPDGQKVDERIYDDLAAMLAACREAGLNPKVCSAYRTQSKQTYLYNNKIARLRNAGYSKAAAIEEAGRWVARPGTSEHQLGLALDIVSSSYQALTKKQEKTAEQKWLMEHCWEYGFILRYPSDKGEITGIGYEPWHYRYVGREVALDIRESGLCLEEYLLLREETRSEGTNWI